MANEEGRIEIGEACSWSCEVCARMKSTWRNCIQDFPAGIPRDDGDQPARRMNTGWPWASEQPPATEERNRYDSQSIGNE